MILSCRLPQMVDVLEMTLAGVEYVAVPKAAIAAIFEVAPEAASPAPPVGEKGLREPAPRKVLNRKSAPERLKDKSGPPSPVRDAVREQLAKRPLTSKELGDILGRDKLPSIYSTLATMRKTGEVVMETGEDLRRVHRLARKAA